MPRRAKGLSRPAAKPGTNNEKQAKARDKRAAKARRAAEKAARVAAFAAAAPTEAPQIQLRRRR